MSLPLAVYLTLLLACTGYAIVRGGTPERIGVAILLTAIALSNALPTRTVGHFVGVELGLLLVDLGMLIAVTVLAIWAQRYWPIWWAGLKLCSVIVHLMMFAPLLMPWSYSVASAALSFASPPLLAIAAFRHRRRQAMYGADPAWSIPAHWSGSDDIIVTAPVGLR